MHIDAFDFGTLEPLHERLCLDFANTTPRHIDLNDDHLNTYADLVAWGLDVNVLNEEQAQHLLDTATHHPVEAEAVLRKAIRLREAIYQILADIARRRPASAAAHDHLNAALSEAMAHMQLVPQNEGYGWTWIDGAEDLAQMLWPVTWSAAELLLSDDLKLIRECDGEDCEWLFLDTSRNHSRRWCDMKTCGNRAKARRHYHRTQGQD